MTALFGQKTMPIDISGLETWQQVLLLIACPALGILLGRILIDLYKKILQSSFKTKALIAFLGYLMLYGAGAYFFGAVARVVMLVIAMLFLLYLMFSLWRQM